ncbi:MAG: hypothetical protein EVA80_11310, partial [Proteobacteria bacterium]
MSIDLAPIFEAPPTHPVSSCPFMQHRRVPVHSLGISQIVSFGLLFYAFAQLKAPLAQSAGVSETTILAAVSG